MISDLPWSEKNLEWVGMDVDIGESTEEDEPNSILDTGEFSEGESINQNAVKQEGQDSRSKGAHLQENSAIEQQLSSGEELSELEGSVIESPLEIIDRSMEVSVPDDEARGGKFVGPESEHVIVDEEVDFEQFGAPPPDLPVIGDLDNERGGGIGSPNGKKGASRGTEVQDREDQIPTLDADKGLEQGASRNLNIETEEGRAAQLEEQYKVHEELNRKLEAECDERLKSEAKLMVLHEMLPNMEEKLKILTDQVQFLEFQLLEQANSRNDLENDLKQERTENSQFMTRLEEQTRLHEELVQTLHEERNERLKSETELMVLRELFPNTEDSVKELCDQVDLLVVQLQEETGLRNSLEKNLAWERQEKMQHITKVEEQCKMHEELSLTIEEERRKNETYLEEIRENMSNKEEMLKDLQNQVFWLTAQLQEYKELKKELEGKWDHECEGRMQGAVTLPVSSMPWSKEKLEFEKLLDEQKTLLANQVQEAELLKDAAEMKVGLLNHQVQNLEELTDIAETMESAFSAKEQVIKQTLWTVFQALCIGVGLMSFVVAYRDPLRSSLQPT